MVAPFCRWHCKAKCRSCAWRHCLCALVESLWALRNAACDCHRSACTALNLYLPPRSKVPEAYFGAVVSRCLPSHLALTAVSPSALCPSVRIVTRVQTAGSPNYDVEHPRGCGPRRQQAESRERDHQQPEARSEVGGAGFVCVQALSDRQTDRKPPGGVA